MIQGGYPSVSIIIRSKNERAWIRHTLEMVLSQSLPPLEIILVDNGSEDGTVEIAKKMGVDLVLGIAEYSPGKALNLGASRASGEILVFLSAHCVPVRIDWLENLVKPFCDQRVAGVYGRQVPLEYSSPSDKRDLHLAFGPESLRQEKNPYFHNANSAVRYSAWCLTKFDEELTNIEDWVWGKRIIDGGSVLHYSADAEVFHFNGLHRSSDPVRERNAVRIIEKENAEEGGSSHLPESLRIENRRNVALIPFSRENFETPSFMEQLEVTIRDVLHSNFVEDIILICDVDLKDCYPELGFFDRQSIPNADELPIDELCQEVARKVFVEDFQADFAVYCNWRSADRPKGILDQLVRQAVERGFDTVFAGIESFSHLWVGDKNGSFERIDSPLVVREKKTSNYLAKYGWGTVVEVSSLVRNGFPSGRVGIIGIPDR